MHNVYLHTGSNLGNRRKHLALANMLIEQRIGAIQQLSSIYETAPWGKTDQPDFYNQALEVNSDLPAKEILKIILEIEEHIGRQRLERWGARTIDIDLLFYGNAVIEEPDLQIPHPRLHLRNFVLLPLAEIAPGLTHPTLGKTMLQLSIDCTDPLTAMPIENE